jgi:alkanesulfonate monooxygenase SsuD/methylene tetrahydromethanopterin reductase-like flavin-dependent oxidoreductase (luciferase family)
MVAAQWGAPAGLSGSRRTVHNDTAGRAKKRADKEETIERLLFGVDVSTSAAAGADPVTAARAAETLGFDFVSANDHPAAHDPRYETWTMLAWIAAATSRIRVATRVLGVPYRSPAMVAKMAETFDRLSGGRLILGLGAGASDQEFRAFGLGVRSPQDKIDGLEEAVRVIRGLWTEPGFQLRRPPLPDRGGRAGAQAGPSHSPSGWEPSAAAAWTSPGGWPTGGSRRWRLPYQTRRRSCVTASCRQRAAGRDPQHITCAYNLEVGWRTRQAEIRRWSRDPRMWWPSDCSGSCGSAYRDEPPPGRSRNPGAA